MGRQEGTTDVTGVLGLCSLAARVTIITEVELLESDARQGKETVHLVGNHRELVGQQGRHRHYWWSWLLSLSATHPERGNENGCPDIIKMTNDLADVLSSLRAYTHYLHVGITRMGAPAS